MTETVKHAAKRLVAAEGMISEVPAWSSTVRPLPDSSRSTSEGGRRRG